MISENPTVSRKLCEECGKEFLCGAQSGACWCFEIKVAPRILSKLKENFSNCLCAKCLAEHGADGEMTPYNL